MPFAEMWMDLKIIITGEVCQKKMLYDVAAFLVVQMVKNLPAVQETWVPSLHWEDLLEKEMATHSSILVWRIPWTEEQQLTLYMWIYKNGRDEPICKTEIKTLT